MNLLSLHMISIIYSTFQRAKGRHGPLPSDPQGRHPYPPVEGPPAPHGGFTEAGAIPVNPQPA